MATRKSSNNINTDIFCALKVAELSKVPVLFLSNPGAGKTTSVYLFAKIRGYEVVLLRGNSTSPEEVTGYDVAPRDVTYDHKMAAIGLRPSWFEEVLRNHEQGKKTLLFLDEITTANEFVQAALLHLIFERKVHNEMLPEDTLIVSAGNYAQNLSNTMSLLPPVMNRFMIFNIIPDHNDLDTFLNRFEGSLVSATGTPKNYFDELEKVMVKLDSQELKVTREEFNKIGEHIERGIRDTARMLMVSGDKPVDMTVTDLQNIYTDTDNDSKLYGFISFRTLNYLRDVTIAYYICFGKAGITSSNYRNSVDGLCGIGVSRVKGGDVKTTKIGKEFVDVMAQVVNDIEKMNNSKLKEYEAFFTNMANVVNTSSKIYSDPDLGAIANKLKELNNDKELKNVSRPIEGSLISNICEGLKKTADSVNKIKAASSDSLLKTISADKFIKNIVTWNMITDVLSSLTIVVKNMDYPDTVKSTIRTTSQDLRSVCFKLRGLRNLIIQEDGALAAMIPDLKSVDLSGID